MQQPERSRLAQHLTRARQLASKHLGRIPHVRRHRQRRDAVAQVETLHVMFDAIGVPRERHSKVFTLEERMGLYTDRLSTRLHTQVENNMLFFNLCRECVLLLEGAPNSSQYRIRTAIEKLRAVSTPSKSSLNPEQQSTSLILPA